MGYTLLPSFSSGDKIVFTSWVFWQDPHELYDPVTGNRATGYLGTHGLRESVMWNYSKNVHEILTLHPPDYVIFDNNKNKEIERSEVSFSDWNLKGDTYRKFQEMDFGFQSIPYLERQLEDMSYAGINAVFLLYDGFTPDQEYWGVKGLNNIVTAWNNIKNRGKNPPYLGLFFGDCLSRESILRRFYENNEDKLDDPINDVDLSKNSGRQLFYKYIRDAISLIPPSMWARIDGKPLILFCNASCYKEGSYDESTFGWLAKELEYSFWNETPMFILDATDPSASDRSDFAGNVPWKSLNNQNIKYYENFGSRNPTAMTKCDIISVGPGFDNTNAIPGDAYPAVVVPRENGQKYIRCWKDALEHLKTHPEKKMIYIDDWGRYDEGAAICETYEYGRQYIDITRTYVNQFNPSITAPYVSTKMTVDGNLSESAWNNITTDISKKVVTIKDPKDQNNAKFGVLWDSTYLYVGVKVLDGPLYNDSQNRSDTDPCRFLFNDDSVEIAIDGDHNRGTTYDDHDRYFLKGWMNYGLDGLKQRWVLHGFETISGPEYGYSIEMAIPWTNLVIIPAPGMTIGFSVGYNDDDDGCEREELVVWAGTGNNFSDTSALGEIVLGAPLTPQPQIINDIVTFEPIESTYQITSDTTGCKGLTGGAVHFQCKTDKQDKHKSQPIITF